MWTSILRSVSVTALLCVSACASASEPAVLQAAVQPAVAMSQTPITMVELTQQQRFDVWKADFTARAIARGYDAALVRAIMARATLNPIAIERDENQPEFNTPVWSYVDNTRSVDRVTRGENKLAEHRALFTEIEARYRVSPYILTAIWGLESSYGRIMGNHDIVATLSTFAYEGRRSKFGEEQLFAIFDIVSSGKVQTSQLTGAWAGAMGMTQFIPTTFRDYAVDFDGNGNKDLWTSEADALGSAAHYLSRFGWRMAEPVFVEVTLPERFDYTLADGRKSSVNDWVARGVQSVSGENFSADAGFLEAKLLVPAGAKGPKMLTFKNFDVIKKYNNSTSYALGISMLADAFADKPGLVQDWPRGDEPVGRTDLIAMQKKLTALGYDTKGADGVIGPNTRRAIRGWQSANGLTADGYIEQTLFKRIMGS